MATLIIREEMGLHLLGTNQDPVSTSIYSVCKEMLLCCSWICIIYFKNMEPLSPYSCAETDVVRSSLRLQKFDVPNWLGIEPETSRSGVEPKASRMANTLSSHLATGSPIYLFIIRDFTSIFKPNVVS